MHQVHLKIYDIFLFVSNRPIHIRNQWHACHTWKGMSFSMDLEDLLISMMVLVVEMLLPEMFYSTLLEVSSYDETVAYLLCVVEDS